MSFRFRASEGVYVVAEQRDDRTWRIDVTDAASRPLGEEARRKALLFVLEELSSLRGHIWFSELKNPPPTEKS